jgi:hypothetical protein
MVWVLVFVALAADGETLQMPVGVYVSERRCEAERAKTEANHKGEKHPSGAQFIKALCAETPVHLEK